MMTLLEHAELFVADLFEQKLPETCIYHNYEHTKRVVKSTKEIADALQMTLQDKELLELTALLHDTGYIKDCREHEKHSVAIATDFLTTHEVSPQKIDQIGKLILATKMEHQPITLLEEIIRDADASHFAKDYYIETSELLRQEFKLHKTHRFSSAEWLAINIDLFRNTHRFYTDYAIEHWGPLKELNLKKLVAAQKKQKAKRKKEQEKIKALFKAENPEKSIQTVFRVTLRNHLKLSDIADTKANILLSVNAIIISLALSNLIPKLDNPSNQYLIYPTLIFVIFSIASMMLSVLATRPNVTSGSFTKKEVEEKKVNLLFFGNFHKMRLDQYTEAMHDVMEDKDYIYDMMIKDLYFLGKVLHRKYKLLRITYTVFMTGIIVSAIAFIIAFHSLTIVPLH